ncbi:MAG: hypothetical protein RLZZ292_3539 [Bacteroidota bacterium]|jgi:hypothetical protein
MVKLGFIVEGPTDRAVLENIIIGYFGEDISEYFTPLQPRELKDSGGWSRVITYCQSTDFVDAFDDSDFVIVQIDTDQSFEFNVLHDENGEKLPVDTLVKNIRLYFDELFQKAFGDTFLTQFGQRILLAITVHSTECWLLPLYFKVDKDKAAIKNCYQKLNKKIEGLNKTYKKYDNISAPYRNSKTLKKHSDINLSFKLFIEELLVKVPIQAKNGENTEGVILEK